MAFIPHTPEDIQKMLAKIGISEIDGLFDEIPNHLPKAELELIPEGFNEQQLLSHAKEIAEKNERLSCFVGAGCYDHHIPSAVWDIATRGEFLTSYTPYQAEVSQGTLQTLYEFQTMLAELFALDVANASLYDGSTALAEAILMAKRIQKDTQKQTVLIPHQLHPEYKIVLKTILKEQNIIIKELPFDATQGVTATTELMQKNIEDVFAVCIVQPNFLGLLEDVHQITNWAKEHGIITIACVNPSTLGVLTPPGCWGKAGVDIACAEGQVFGIPMSAGGPMVGFISTKKEYVRQLPGRIVGLTIDNQQRPGFALTLQAREQHIRRAKATSNICTNQGLNVVAATIYMSLLGPQGLKMLGEACYQNTHYLVEELCKIPGVKLMFSGPFFHEAVVKFDTCFETLLEEFKNNHILPGLILAKYDSNFKNCLLICATEKRSPHDIHAYIQCVKNMMLHKNKNSHACQIGV